MDAENSLYHFYCSHKIGALYTLRVCYTLVQKKTQPHTKKEKKFLMS